ncbi:MAG: hypothetical protein IJ436_06195 [Bacteroidaceae bacterium]|nr:hypothetical protein [Bacteroidaceae bacterium]
MQAQKEKNTKILFEKKENCHIFAGKIEGKKAEHTAAIFHDVPGLSGFDSG